MFVFLFFSFLSIHYIICVSFLMVADIAQYEDGVRLATLAVGRGD